MFAGQARLRAFRHPTHGRPALGMCITPRARCTSGWGALGRTPRKPPGHTGSRWHLATVFAARLLCPDPALPTHLARSGGVSRVSSAPGPASGERSARARP